jgi:hypothetical protein
MISDCKTEKKDRVMSVRFAERYWQLIREVCNYRNEDVSDFIRRAVLKELASLSYLTKEQKKALGIAGKKRKDQLTGQDDIVIENSRN